MRATHVAFCVSALAVAVVIGVLAVANIALNACYNLQALLASKDGDRAASGRAAAEGTPKAPPIHVCFCSGDADLRPLVVAIRSVVASAAAPERLLFHYVTSQEGAERARDILRWQLPAVRIQVHHNSQLQSHIDSFLIGTNKDLGTSFSLAPFYLHEFLPLDGERIERAVVLAVDVVVQGDVGELVAADLSGRVCAAVQDCRRRYEDLVDWSKLRQLGLSSRFDSQACAAAHGGLVIDMRRWQQQRITERIEEWLVRAHGAGQPPLWRGSDPHAPWLLAIGAGARSDVRSGRAVAAAPARSGGRAADSSDSGFMELKGGWGCEGLASDAMSITDAVVLKRQGLNDTAMSLLRVTPDADGNMQPRVVACSAKAKLLHFSGAAKPWMQPEGFSALRTPLCAVAPTTRMEPWNGTQAFRIEGHLVNFVACHEIWARYISDSVLVGDAEDDDDDDDLPVVDGGAAQKPVDGWVSNHQRFLDNLKKQVDDEQSLDREAEKEHKLKKLLDRQKRREQELGRRKVIGGFLVGQKVRSVSDISVRGAVVVRKAALGTIQGPSAKHPEERINVFFKGRVDGKFRSVNVLPREIYLAEGD